MATLKSQKAINSRFFEDHPEFRDEYRTRKKHNDYSTDCRCAYVDWVDYMNRNGEISDALRDRTTLDAGCLPKNPNKGRKLSQSAKIQRYISDCIDLGGYPDTGKPAAVQVWEEYLAEYDYPENTRRYGPAGCQRHFTEWLKGLPSIVGGIAYMYTDQRQLLESWGIPAPDDDCAMADKFNAVIYREFLRLFNLQSKKQ